MLPALSGAKTIYGPGMLELGMSFSLEQFVIDNDYIPMVEKAAKGISVTEETLAVEAILKVGAGNNFLAHKTTRNNMGIQSNPNLINRDMIGDWEHAGSKGIVDSAHEVVVDVLKNHEVKPIDADILKDMETIVEKADKNFAMGIGE